MMIGRGSSSRMRVRLDRGDLRVHRADDVGGRAAARPVAPDRALVVQRPRRIACAHPAGGGVVVRRRSRSRCRATRGSRWGGSCRARPCSGRARRTRPCSAGRRTARRRTRATRRSPRRPRTGRSGRRGRASTGRSGSATTRAALTLNCFISRTSASIDARVSARPRVSSCSCRLTPLMRTRLAVHEQLPVAHLDVAEAGADGDRLAAGAQLERVERRLLGRPVLRRAHRGARGGRRRAAAREERPAARIEQRHLAVDACVDRELAVPQLVVERRANLEVANGRRADVDRAREAGVPPLILVLDEARVRPADDDGVQLVRPVVVDELRDVELGRRLRVLGEADRLAVDEHVEHALERAEVQHRPAGASSRAARVKRAAVDAGLVLARARSAADSANGICDVRVLRLAEALHRPEARHLDACSSRAARRSASGASSGRCDQAEVPLAVERGEPRRAGAVERRVRREPVQARELRQHPAAPRRRGRAAPRAPLVRLRHERVAQRLGRGLGRDRVEVDARSRARRPRRSG